MKKKTIVFIVIVMMLLLVACGVISDPWPKTGLGAMLPKPAGKIEILVNDDDYFSASVEKMKEEDQDKYLEQCIALGFNIDVYKTGGYKAFNEEGYEFSFHAAYDNMDIYLKAPIQIGTLRWPSGAAGKLIPKPESTTGKNEWEYDDSFCLYVGDMPYDQYVSYVDKCFDAGFNIDYDRGDRYFYADNESGHSLSLKYEGFDIVFIRIDKPDEESNMTEEDSEKIEEVTDSNEKTSEEEQIEDDSAPIVPDEPELEEKEEVIEDNEKPAEQAEVSSDEVEIADSMSVYYSTNDQEKVKDGNAGMYSYFKKGPEYNVYVIIDFDEGNVYYFLDNEETCERIKIDSGDLNDIVLFTYHVDGETWQEAVCFKYKRNPSTLLYQDADANAVEFKPFDLEDALKIRDSKTIQDY